MIMKTTVTTSSVPSTEITLGKGKRDIIPVFKNWKEMNKETCNSSKHALREHRRKI